MGIHELKKKDSHLIGVVHESPRGHLVLVAHPPPEEEQEAVLEGHAARRLDAVEEQHEDDENQRVRVLDQRPQLLHQKYSWWLRFLIAVYKHSYTQYGL